MTTRKPALAAFALASDEGRTPQPLNILGAETVIKLADADTNGAAAIFRQTVPPLGGPALHRHSREDEWFYVLDGEITTEIDGQRSVLRAGDSAFAPRGTAHAFRNFGDSPARILVMTVPGRFSRFLEEVSSLNAGRSTPDMAGTERLMNDYGMERLGPQLAAA
jgi:quercetin dioxygenase-like cupin family protein